MKKKNNAKKEVYFIATKYKNKPASVSYFTKKDGKEVDFNNVEKKYTNEGIKYFAAAN